MVTQYVGSSQLTGGTIGWKKQNVTLTATSLGGKIRGDDSANVQQVWYNLGNGATGGKSRESDPNMKAGVRYVLQGLKIKRDTTDATIVRVALWDMGRDPNNSQVFFDVPSASMPVGQWVRIPNLSLPLNWIGIANNGFLSVQLIGGAGDDQLDFTFTHANVYQQGQQPAGYSLEPDFTFDAEYLRVTFTDDVFDGAVPLTWSWNFGDGSPVVNGRNPVHTFTASGTYNVTLTLSNGVNADQSITKAVTVAAPPVAPPGTSIPAPPPVPPVPPVLNPYTDMLSLQVHADPAEGDLVNLVKNASGELGSFGWVTPTVGSVLRGTNDPNGYTGYQPALLYEAKTGVSNYMYTEPLPVEVGDYVGATWRPMYVGNWYRERFEFLDAAFTVLSQGPQGPYRSFTGAAQAATPALVPAGAAYARLRFDFYANNTGSIYLAANWKFAVRDVNVVAGPSSASVTTPWIVPQTGWVDILGPTHELRIERAELDVGTLSAVVLDATLDPAAEPMLRRGNVIRVQAPNTETGAWENIFEGRIDNAVVTYVPRVRIELTATDNVAALTNVPRPDGVQTIGELPWLLEGAGVPWMVNDSGDQVGAATVVSHNDNASLLDQLAITRDTALGYAWIDRYNVVRAYDGSAMPATPVTVLDEQDYSDLDISFDPQTTINVVTVKWLRYDPDTWETTEVTYGPYTDPDSIDTWGYLSAEFTIHGAVEDEAAIEAYAQRVLDANANPDRRINSVTMPIRSTEDLIPGKGLADLYDLVTASHAESDTSHDLRVTGIGHQIAADPRRGVRWSTVLSFTTDGTVATPQVTPSPPPPSPIPVDTTPVPWTAYVPTFTATTTNPTLGNFSRVGRYTYEAKTKTVRFVIVITALAASGYGTGTYLFGLPMPARNVDELVCVGAQTTPVRTYNGRADTVNVFRLHLTSDFSVANSVNSAVANGTVIRISGTYEAA